MIWWLEIYKLYYLENYIYKILALNAMWCSVCCVLWCYRNNHSYIYVAVPPCIYKAMSFRKTFEQRKCQNWE